MDLGLGATDRVGKLLSIEKPTNAFFLSPHGIFLIVRKNILMPALSFKFKILKFLLLKGRNLWCALENSQ